MTATNTCMCSSVLVFLQSVVPMFHSYKIPCKTERDVVGQGGVVDGQAGVRWWLGLGLDVVEGGADDICSWVL